MQDIKKELKRYVIETIKLKGYLEDISVEEVRKNLGYTEKEAQKIKNSDEYKEFKAFWKKFWKDFWQS